MAKRDSVDDHVARWAAFWADNPDYDPEVEGALVRMLHVGRWLKRNDARVFADADMTFEDYRTLHVLMVQPFPTEATPAQLAEAANVTRAAMTSRLDRLANAELITREVEPQDRRRVIVRPTAAGRAAWDRHVHQEMIRDRAVFATLTRDELTRLNDLLRKVVADLDDRPA